MLHFVRNTGKTETLYTEHFDVGFSAAQGHVFVRTTRHVSLPDPLGRKGKRIRIRESGTGKGPAGGAVLQHRAKRERQVGRQAIESERRW